MFKALGFTRADDKAGKRRRPRRPNWTARDRFLAPHEKRFGTMLKGVWGEERRVILGNMRKYPLKAWPPKQMPGGESMSEGQFYALALHKGEPIVDNWMYPSTRFTAKLSTAAQRVLATLLGESITRIIAEGSFDVAFNVVNDRAIEWLNEYVIKLSANLEEVNLHDLKTALMEGIDAGESMVDLRNRVNEVFETYDSARAEAIARTETIRAQEEGNQEVYKEAGFERKVWFANPDACKPTGKPSDAGRTFCSDLNDIDVPIDESFVDGEDVMAPPLHPNCRCSSAPWDESWGD
ncbi:MAG: hypothetical protein IMZ71_04720 [Chloroflexi bacterium]|nr:hypothetical protein [Chloroflexota bacterium]